eukprot:GHVT01009500.1.p1 GENE.GHVT01009500.1~~GHVT01009500.1.p1  ORF type:complete len:105 (-),score=3.96 GHVT01009500.1:105-419(-)
MCVENSFDWSGEGGMLSWRQPHYVLQTRFAISPHREVRQQGRLSHRNSSMYIVLVDAKEKTDKIQPAKILTLPHTNDSLREPVKDSRTIYTHTNRSETCRNAFS